MWSSYNSVGMCDFVGAPLNGLEMQPMVDYINSVTGWNMSIYELMKVGVARARPRHRVIRRAVAARVERVGDEEQRLHREDERHRDPERPTECPGPRGARPSTGTRHEADPARSRFRKTRSKYESARKGDRPTETKLAELGLEDAFNPTR